VSRRSPFQVVLTADERRVLEARVRRRKAEQRDVLRARIVLATAQGAENKQIAERLGIAPNTASKWRKRFIQEAWQDSPTGTGQAGREPSPRRSSRRSRRSPVSCPPCGRSR
jgi:hypothetical protein